MKILKTNETVAQVYNDGVITFYSKTDAEDEYGTPIAGVETEMLKAWYRRMGGRAEDVFYARSLGKDINLKVAIRGEVYINPHWSAKATNKYEVYSVDYNPKNDETIISLKEV